jgi:HEAT repeat protein
MGLPVERDDFTGWVGLLRDPVRARSAYWHLLGSGDAALPAIRSGLEDANADVRMYCAKVLDHLADEDSFPALVAMLDDPDERVRWDTLHALACDRCKDTVCRPDKDDVLPRAVHMLRADPSRHVRAIAVEVVGRWVHTDQTAVDALVEARDSDPEPSVRNKAGWYAPGGTIHRKTQPRS